MREIKGQVHNVSNDYKIISIQVVDKLEFFYLQPRFVKNFRKYLYPGVFVQFTVNEDKFKMKKRLVSKVVAFEKIIGNRYHRKFSYFDQRIVKQKNLDKISQYDYRLFLDLEMTMQYSKRQSEEIVQAGAVLVNQYDEVLFEFNSFIKPTKIDKVSKRTLEFLGITQEQIDSGISYRTFYNQFKEIIENYHPAIIVWGNNDLLALEKSYIINKIKPIFNKKDFINMQAVHKEFYNINYELGLFNTADIYNISSGEQEHDAYIDALVTREIFNKFYYYAINNIDYEFKKIMLTKM